MARLLAAHLMLLSLLTPAVGQDGTAAKLPPTIQIDASDLKVPDGDVQEMIAFLRKTTNLQQQLNREYRDAMTRINIALLDAGKGVLQNPEELSDEDFESAASIALTPRVRAIAKADEPEKRAVFELVKRQLSIAIRRGVGSKELSNASTLASYLDRSDDDELAILAYQTFAELFRQSGDDKLKPLVERFEGSARRLGLLGNSIEVTGKLVDGSEFDWNKYQGKVVLVDYWATWCGPCIAEAPKVRKMYDLYHDRGFEVVGISLDTDKKKLNDYLNKEEVPWENLFEPGKGWKHPMAIRYGVHAIPAAWLVDQHGRVVSLSARGDELGKQLGLLIGPRFMKPRSLAIERRWKDVAEEMKSLVTAGEGGNSYRVGLSVAQILSGDLEGYAESCRPAWERYHNSHRWAQATSVRLCCLAPDSGVDPKEIQRVAHKAAESIDDSDRFNSQRLARMMANFRAGDYEACVDDEFEGGDPVQQVIVVMVRAMSAHHLGRKEDASEYFSVGNRFISEELSDPSGKKATKYMDDHWIGCAIAQVFHSEAQALLGQ
jgi:thiol-disulfide isomerase/thioredoxin